MKITSCIKVTALFSQAALVVLCIGAPARAQSGMDRQPANSSSKPVTHIGKFCQRWLDEDVHWIITPEERAAFLQLSKDEDCDRFVEAFWQRRNPTPGTAENEFRNEFKEEHYRRIAYSNEHFAQEIAGWKTDRGRVYIVYGPPSEIKTESTVTSEYSVKPAELWHYNSIKGYGKNVDLRFVDVCKCGDYRLETHQKNWLFPDN